MRRPSHSHMFPPLSSSRRRPFTSSTEGVQKVTSVEGITEYAFPNGLHVLLFRSPLSVPPRAAGLKDESPSDNG